MPKGKKRKRKKHDHKNKTKGGPNNSKPFGVDSQNAKNPKYLLKEKVDSKLLMTIHKHPDSSKYQYEYNKFIFDPDMWGSHYKLYHKPFQPAKVKGMRILIAINTLNSILNAKYYVYTNEMKNNDNDNNKNNDDDDDDDDHDDKNDDATEEKKVEGNEDYKIIKLSKPTIIDSVSKTIMHFEDDLFCDNFFSEIGTNDNDTKPTKYLLFEEDILDVCSHIMKTYRVKPVVLVMSSKDNAGGGFKNGNGAQEEDMVRRTTLLFNLSDPYNYKKKQRQWSYPIPEFGGIYSPKVLVFRHSMNRNYQYFEDHPLKMSFISVYSYQSPPLDANLGLSKSMQKRVIKKIETILRIAMVHKHRNIILSALGCGAYEMPPLHVAKLFKIVLDRKEYQSYFDVVVFAIINDKNTMKSHNPNGNVQPFAFVFDLPILKINDIIDDC